MQSFQKEITERLIALEQETEETGSPQGPTETRKRLLTGTVEPPPPPKRSEFDLEETDDSGNASGSQTGILDLTKVKKKWNDRDALKILILNFSD